LYVALLPSASVTLAGIPASVPVPYVMVVAPLLPRGGVILLIRPGLAGS
jgi:hypothetical protein